MRQRMLCSAIAALVLVVISGCGGDKKEPPKTPPARPAAATAPAQAGAPAVRLEPGQLVTRAEGVAECRGMRVALQTAFAVWNSNDHSLRIELYPFALTDEDKQRVINVGAMRELRSEKGCPDPSVWGTSTPSAEIILRFAEDAESYGLESLRDVQMGFTDFDASPNVSSIQAFARPESDYVQQLSLSGTHQGDGVRLRFLTPEGRDTVGKLEVAVDATLAAAQ